MTDPDPIRIPKRIAGIKLPKPLRHAVEEALAQLTSSAGRLVLASALEAAAAVLRRGAHEAEGARPAGSSTIDRVGPMIGLAANALGQWLGDAARKPADKADPAPGGTADAEAHPS